MEELYQTIVIKQIISIEFSKNKLDMSYTFIQYARDHIEGKCRSEGYIRPKSCKIISYTAPIMKDNDCIYEVCYECQACNPEIDNIYSCRIMKLAKIGIRAVISTTHNPIVFYISREHNSTINFEDYNEGDQINVKIIGKRFQLNDSHIEVIAEIMK